MKINYPIVEPYVYSINKIIIELQSHADVGLSQSEAGNRNKTFGDNVYKTQKQKSIFLMMLLQFKSPIVYL